MSKNLDIKSLGVGEERIQQLLVTLNMMVMLSKKAMAWRLQLSITYMTCIEQLMPNSSAHKEVQTIHP
jgi:hypothetical protein